MQVKIVQIGNSYGVRLPKDYIRRNKLMLGQYIHVPNTQSPQGNLAAVVQKAQDRAKQGGTSADINTIVVQQRTERNTWQNRQNKQNRLPS